MVDMMLQMAEDRAASPDSAIEYRKKEYRKALSNPQVVRCDEDRAGVEREAKKIESQKRRLESHNKSLASLKEELCELKKDLSGQDSKNVRARIINVLNNIYSVKILIIHTYMTLTSLTKGYMQKDSAESILYNLKEDLKDMLDV